MRYESILEYIASKEEILSYNKKMVNVYTKMNDLETAEFHTENIKELECEIKLAKQLIEIATSEDLEIVKSPYSSSFYATNSEINWGDKPEKSYRLSNHWNWYDRFDIEKTGELHCPTNTNKDFGLAIAQYVNGKYVKVL